jgi:hypothetical protein
MSKTLEFKRTGKQFLSQNLPYESSNVSWHVVIDSVDKDKIESAYLDSDLKISNGDEIVRFSFTSYSFSGDGFLCANERKEQLARVQVLINQLTDFAVALGEADKFIAEIQEQNKP